jgi:hypothetical protein
MNARSALKGNLVRLVRARLKGTPILAAGRRVAKTKDWSFLKQ